MLFFPNAKINLGLNVVRRREDGYHDIETVFYPIPVKDALEVTAASARSFRQSGIVVDAPPEKNLVMRALALMEELYGVPPLEVNLFKAIPFGAGLGGGSSDAAFMLKAVNQFCGLAIDDDTLETLAARLGADCPFFVRNRPAFATGTGNVFESVELDLRGWHLCLVKPDIFVSTAAAYSHVRPAAPPLSLRDIVDRPVEEWRGVMRNDFEESVFGEFPEIGAIKDAMYAEGAVYASMSGSGSSVYGLFDHATDLSDRFEGCYVWEGAL